MIYILSGIAKSGKSLVSKEIVEKHALSVFSTDYIMMMLARGNKDLNIDTHASDSTVANVLEPYIYGLIKTMIENGDSHVFEGVHFNPEFTRRLKDEFGNLINEVYLGYKDVKLEDKITELYKYKDVMNNPWLFNHTDSVEDITKYMIKESNRIYHECVKHNLTYIEVYDMNNQKSSIIDELIK